METLHVCLSSPHRIINRQRMIPKTAMVKKTPDLTTCLPPTCIPFFLPFEETSLSHLFLSFFYFWRSMGRGRVQLKRIENTINRQVTFSKRRAGLLKKANEISVLCDVDVALVIFSTKGKLSEYSTDGRMESILERYERYSFAESAIAAPEAESQEIWYNEYGRLKAKIEALLSSQRHLMGVQLDMLNVKEMQQLEQKLESAIKNIRSRKNQLLIDSISELHRKEKALLDQNKDLKKKITEKETKKTSAQQGHGDQQGQQYIESSSPLSFPVQDPPSLTIGINPASGSSEEDNEDHPQPPVNRSNLPPWMIHSVNG